MQTETQAARLEREAKARLEKARAEASLAKKKAGSKARKADNWIVQHLASLSEGASSALVLANITAVVGISGFLGFKAYRLFDAGRLSWQTAGLGVGVLGTVGLVEGVFARYVFWFSPCRLLTFLRGASSRHATNFVCSYFYRARGGNQ